ncbi:MAG: tryptophan 2,3-dioxygenase [Candidatus Eremiobacteraeota bacterium]|nr:tryptophan 2,3-dioxygenase [Candidatus Eremiobacteraeota bacterium]
MQRLTYGSYLRVPELLALQEPLSSPPHHDELLFITIHQVYELWFKQLLHELAAVLKSLNADRLLRTAKEFSSIHTIQRLLEAQVDILETMTPQEFNEFRDHLRPASGFQSLQFREIEFLCGLKGTDALKHLETSAEERSRLERRLDEPTLSDAVYGLLKRRGFAVETHDERVSSLKQIYEEPDKYYDLYLLLEDLIEFDERFLLWRSRHILMVERMIGSKMGTGGSLGVAYLATTLNRKFFPELWEVRTYLGKGQYG